MQCNFLGQTTQGHGLADLFPKADLLPNDCIAGPSEYKTTEEDQKKYCKNDFRDCPRYITRLQLEKNFNK